MLCFSNFENLFSKIPILFNFSVKANRIVSITMTPGEKQWLVFPLCHSKWVIPRTTVTSWMDLMHKQKHPSLASKKNKRWLLDLFVDSKVSHEYVSRTWGYLDTLLNRTRSFDLMRRDIHKVHTILFFPPFWYIMRCSICICIWYFFYCANILICLNK